MESTIPIPTSTIDFGSGATISPLPEYSGPVFPQPPNYENPETVAPEIIGINAAFLALALLAVGLRTISRLKLAGRMYSEDWLAILAWIFSFVVGFFVSWSTKAGVGRHWWDIPPEMYLEMLKVPAGYIMAIFYPPTHGAIKMSILIFYLRLGSALDFSFKMAIYFVMFYVISSETIATFILIFRCDPIAANWDFSVVLTAKCLDPTKLYFAVGVVNVISDLMILLLPVKMLWRIRLPRRQMFQVSVVFGLGSFVTIVSVVRLYYVDLANKSLADFMWYGGITALWSAVEVNVAIVCGCLPAIKPLLAHWWPRVFGSGTESLQPASPFSPNEGGITIGGRGRTPGIGLNFVSRFSRPNPSTNSKGNSSKIKNISLTGGSTTISSNGEYELEQGGPGNTLRGNTIPGNGGPGNINKGNGSTGTGRNMRAYPGRSDIYRGDLHPEDDYLYDDDEYDEEECASRKAGRKCSCAGSEGGCTLPHEHHYSSVGSNRSPRGLGYMSTVHAGLAHGSEEHIISKTGEEDLERGVIGHRRHADERGMGEGITKTTEVRINVRERSKRRCEGAGRPWGSRATEDAVPNTSTTNCEKGEGHADGVGREVAPSDGTGNE